MSREEEMMRKAFAFETASEAYQGGIDSYDMYKLIGYLIKGIARQINQSEEKEIHGEKNVTVKDWYDNLLKHDCTDGYAE